MKYRKTPKRLWQHPRLQHRATISHAVFSGGMSMLLLLLLLLLPFNCVNASTYSYTRFIGPVTGPERKIFVNDEISSNDGNAQIRGSWAPRFDYVGKPEYEFAYGVEDADAQVLHNRKEMRDGDAVKGVYSLIDPDGVLRVVKYTADEANGFQAEVIRNGVSSLHGQLHHDYNQAPHSKTTYNNHYNPNYKSHSLAPQALFKGDRIVGHPSVNSYKSNAAQQPPMLYHYSKSYGYDDGDDDDNDDEDEDYITRSNESGNLRPYYEVHEYPDEGTDENQHDDHHGCKSYKNQHLDADEDGDDDNDDDEDYDDERDSEEMDDYDEIAQANDYSEESYDYY